MTLLIASIVLTALTFITLFVISAANRRRFGKIRMLLPFLSFAWFLILLFGKFTVVKANEVGIIYHDKRGVLEEVKYEGFQTKSIFEHITPIGTANKTANLIVAGQTQDSAYATFDITVVYRIQAADAGNFYKCSGTTDISVVQMDSLAKEALQSATINFDIYSILGENLEALRVDFVKKLKEMMYERYYITIVSASFNDIDAGAQIEAIIQRKAEAIQQVEIAEQEKQKAEVEKQTALIKAQAEAEVALLKAQAQAESQQLLNSVTVNAINSMYLGQFDNEEEKTAFETTETGGFLTIQEISEIILKQLYYDTWDGKLPEVVTDGSGLIIQPGN